MCGGWGDVWVIGRAIVSDGGGYEVSELCLFQKKGQVRPNEKNQTCKKRPITHKEFELKFRKFRTSYRIFFHLKT